MYYLLSLSRWLYQKTLLQHQQRAHKHSQINTHRHIYARTQTHIRTHTHTDKYTHILDYYPLPTKLYLKKRDSDIRIDATCIVWTVVINFIVLFTSLKGEEKLTTHLQAPPPARPRKMAKAVWPKALGTTDNFLYYFTITKRKNLRILEKLKS